MKATITSAIELSSTQLSAVKKMIEKKYGSDVTYETQVKPEVIGGLRITIGSQQYDLSIKGQLEALESSISRKW